MPSLPPLIQRSNIDGLQLSGIPDSPELLESFDVFMIGDVDSSYFQAKQLELIRGRVQDGAGLIMIGVAEYYFIQVGMVL